MIFHTFYAICLIGAKGLQRLKVAGQQPCSFFGAFRQYPLGTAKSLRLSQCELIRALGAREALITGECSITTSHTESGNLLKTQGLRAFAVAVSST